MSIETDSAGTIGYHEGRPPDPRAIEHAQRWGIDISAERARQVLIEDFERFDRIFAMDRSNLEDLLARAPAGFETRVGLLMDLAPDYGIEEVPDPYYGGPEGFERVLDMLETAADRLIEALQREGR
ncbi:protein-tyrosine phosphatase [Wenzhouxiangella marina]|nr:protein-tyrosine phosphatase [Wenzhouxiangella marina]